MKEPERQSVSPEIVWDGLSPQAKFVSVCFAKAFVDTPSDVTVPRSFIQAITTSELQSYPDLQQEMHLNGALDELVAAGVVVQKQSILEFCGTIIKSFNADIHRAQDTNELSRRKVRLVALAADRLWEVVEDPQALLRLAEPRYRFSGKFKQFFDTSFVWDVNEQELPRAWLEINK